MAARIITVSPSVARLAARVRVHSGLVWVAVVRVRVSLQRPPLEALSTQMVVGVAAWAGVNQAAPSRRVRPTVMLTASLASVWAAGCVVLVILQSSCGPFLLGVARSQGPVELGSCWSGCVRG